MKKNVSILQLLKSSFTGWQKDKATVWSASLAYFTIFSIGPLLLLIISIIGLVSAKTSFEDAMFRELQGLVGIYGVNIIRTIVSHAKNTTSGMWGSIIGTITLILGATGLFGQLQEMMNSIWGVTQRPKSGMLQFILNRLLNFSIIGVVAFLLLVSLIATTVISGIGNYITHFLPFSVLLLQIINMGISLILTTFLFAVIMKVLPDVKIQWRNIWVGASTTAILFTIGKSIIGIYIGHSGVASEYGAAGSLVVLLLWVYYSSQILFFGTELTKSYTLLKGEEIVASKYGVLSGESQSPIKPKTTHKQAEALADEIARGFTRGVLSEIRDSVRRKKIAT